MKLRQVVWGEKFTMKQSIGTLEVGKNYEVRGFGMDIFEGKRLECWILNHDVRVPKLTLDKLYEKGLIKKI